VLGLTESFATGYVSSDYEDVFAFSLLVLILIFKRPACWARRKPRKSETVAHMLGFKEIKNGLLVSLWFVFLTFPLMVVKVDPVERIVSWRWENSIYVAIGTFVIYCVVKIIISTGPERMPSTKEGGQEKEVESSTASWHRRSRSIR